MNPPKQIWQAIAEDIKENILNGIYKPDDRLKETELAKKYSVSKTPVREALRHLGSMGFVEIIPNRMARVSRMHKKDVQTLYRIEAFLEGLAAREALANLTEKDLKKMENYGGLIEKYSVEKRSREYEKANIQFHSILWNASKNRKLIDMISFVRGQLQRFRSITRQYPERFRDLAGDHRKIIQAARDKDGDRIEAISRDHVEKQEKYILDILERGNHI
ncbi:MAG: GntR family transcriptional regulator [Deltaproteobacteria bacterium]|nr:GntR family transcriptional regulator [Deltaproteobacteria bacterium]